MMNGSQIRDARHALRIKQLDLAAFCGIRPDTLSHIEHGHGRVPLYLDMVVTLLAASDSNVKTAFERARLYKPPPGQTEDRELIDARKEGGAQPENS